MAETTVEVTEGESSGNVAETTTVEAVAETAKSEGAAEQSAEQASEAATTAEISKDVATDAAQASMTAQAVAQAAASEAQAANEQTRYTLESLGASVAQLTETVAQLVASQTPHDVPPEEPSTIEVDSEPEQTKGHWLTRRIGVRK